MAIFGAAAAASTIDETNTSQVTLQTGDSLIFTLSSSVFSSGGNLQYPGEMEMVLGSMPLGGPVESLPGTSSVYIPGILFTGVVQSANGAVSIPLDDPAAARLGLPTGDMLLTPGAVSDGSYSGPIDLLSADITLTTPEAAALFSSGDIEIELQNSGAPITFGYSGSPLSTDFEASLITEDGSESEGVRVMGIQCIHTPEPGTIGLLLIGLGLIGRRARGLARRAKI